ncbi:hypothetical protein GGP72_003303 [Salinibacter ruber]|uniref:Uncharacterized protein n=1 Tax=Salinibacter ruber TaxID=146919 RepID=A0A9X2Q186_9BACT|nr:hypothetical protein [Salinibacter ruber]MCS3679353.1 hypothetical protein [Salinibacter ruber]MCS3682639.1 hypothetical protein [Salinibacter ruber]
MSDADILRDREDGMSSGGMLQGGMLQGGMLQGGMLQGGMLQGNREKGSLLPGRPDFQSRPFGAPPSTKSKAGL